MARRPFPKERVAELTEGLFTQLEDFIRSPECLILLMRVYSLAAWMIQERAACLKKDRIFSDEVREKFATSFKIDREQLKKLLAYMEYLKDDTNTGQDDPIKGITDWMQEVYEAAVEASRGRRSFDDVWREAHNLKELGASWSQVARELSPKEFRADPYKAKERIRSGVIRWRKRKLSEET